MSPKSVSDAARPVPPTVGAGPTPVLVGISDAKLSACPGARLITYHLGSCLGVTIHDPVAHVGGLLHAMLPDSQVHPEQAETNPFMFVDTGVPELFRAAYALGAAKPRLVVKIAGAAKLHGGSMSDCFRIGERNVQLLERLLAKNGIEIAEADVGSTKARTMMLEVGSGLVTIRSAGSEYSL